MMGIMPALAYHPLGDATLLPGSELGALPVSCVWFWYSWVPWFLHPHALGSCMTQSLSRPDRPWCRDQLGRGDGQALGSGPHHRRAGHHG
jgi:hypothetical protein